MWWHFGNSREVESFVRDGSWFGRERMESERWRLKHCVHGRLEARMKVAAPIIEIRGVVFGGLEASGGTDSFCCGSWAARADNIVDGRDKLSDGGCKVILPNTQSINGL